MTSRRPLVFAAVGAVNTVVDVVVFLLLRAPLGAVPATVLSTSAGMAVSFTLNRRVTFRAGRATWSQAMRFVAINVAVFWGVQPVVVVGVLQSLGSTTAAALVAKLAATGVSLVLTYLLYRGLVWPVTGSSAMAGVAPPRTAEQDGA